MEKFLVKAIHKTGKYIEELVESNNPNKVILYNISIKKGT